MADRAPVSLRQCKLFEELDEPGLAGHVDALLAARGLA